MEKAKYIVAVGIGVLPIYLIMIWYRLAYQVTFTPFEMLGYPLIFGGGNILLILLLNSYLLKGKVADFNSGKGVWYTDLTAALILTAVYFSMKYVEQFTLAGWLPAGPPPSPELFDMLRELAGDPVLLALWLGPVVWIGIALFEELSRTFFLNCLWKLSENGIWPWVVILLSAVLIGGAHIYQGLFGFVSIGLKSVVMGAYYYRYRRIWPLIISHALYDSIQVVYLTTVL